MADPFRTIGAVYDALGLEFTADAESRMRAFLDTHPGDGGGGGSRYTFADTRLDVDELRERSRAYQEFFDVPSEPVRLNVALSITVPPVEPCNATEAAEAD